MSYDPRVESGVKAVRTGPGTCLIGKESEMYSKMKEKDRFITPRGAKAETCSF